ncbi:MAG: hypothetical protein GKR90_22665 [Pseudomonadales bacterium]|nr:hypothetical protein [Pseudomonadales bacterium]
MTPLQISELLGNLGEFLGSIAVFITLIYLAIQVRQSKQATEANTLVAQQNYEIALAQNHVSRTDLIVQLSLELARSRDLSEIWLKWENEGVGSLNELEKARFENYNLAILYALDSQHAQYSLGLLDEDGWADAERRIKVLADTWAELDFEGVGRRGFVEEIARIKTS